MAQKYLSSPNPPSAEPGSILFETERLIMRRYLPSDAPDLARIGDDPAIAAVMSDRYPVPYTVEAAAEYISGKRGDQDPAAPPGYPRSMGVFLKPSNPEFEEQQPVLIGSMGARAQEDIFHRTWEIGYFLGKDYWGKGYMSEAVTGLTRWLFKTWPDLVRIGAGRFGSNVASGKVLERAGFVQEGVKRKAMVKKGVVEDEVVYGLIRSDIEGLS